MASTPFSTFSAPSSMPLVTNSRCAHNFFLRSDIPVHNQILQAPEIRSMDHTYHKSHVEPFSSNMNLTTEATEHVLSDASYYPRDISFMASFPHNHSFQSHHSSMAQDDDQYPAAHHHFRHSYQSTTTFQELEATHYLAMLHGTANPPHNFSPSPSVEGEVIKTEPVVTMLDMHNCDPHHHYHHHYHGMRRTQSMESFSTVPRLYSENVLARWPTDYDCQRSVSPNSSESTPIHLSEEELQQQQQQHPHYLSVTSVDGTYSSPAPHYHLQLYPSATSVTVQDHAHSEMSSPSLSSSCSTSVPSSSTTTSISTSYSPALSSASPILHLKRVSVDVVMSDIKPSLMTTTTTIPPSSSSSSASTSFTTSSPSSLSGSSSLTAAAAVAKKCKPQRYFCTVPNCNRAFSRPYNLKSHGLTHNPHRPYACDLCAKSFSRVHDRDRHLNSHMEEKPHVCIVCQGRFARQDAVIRHLKLSNETNACSWILKSRGIQFRDVASGRITRASLGDERVIRETLEALEEQARKVRATRTMELVAAGTGAQAAAAAAQVAAQAKIVEETFVKKEEF